MHIIHISADKDDGFDARWDAYVGPRTTTVTDLSTWRRTIYDTYGMQSSFLAAIEGDQIVGCLGLFEVKNAVFGHYLVTAAFANDGGFHFDNDGVRDALLSEAKALADKLEVDYLLVRTRGVELDGFQVDRHYEAAVINLSGGVDEVWKNTLSAKTRNQVRRGMKEGFTVETGHHQMSSFFDVFHHAMRDLGTPAHCKRFYESVIKHLGDRAEFFVVRDGRKLVAGSLLFWMNDTAMNLHTVALHKYNRRCPNYLIYWKMIEASCAHGCTRFDMGRSVAGSTNLAFKMNWGPELFPLCYNYYLRTIKDIPYVNPRNARYRLPIILWRQLPVFVTKAVGPHLITGLT